MTSGAFAVLTDPRAVDAERVVAIATATEEILVEPLVAIGAGGAEPTVQFHEGRAFAVGMQHPVEELKQVAQATIRQRRRRRGLPFPQTDPFLRNMRVRHVGMTVGRMRLQGRDPIRFLLIQAREIQSKLERAERDAFQVDRFGRDEQLVVVNLDGAEFVFGRRQLRVDLSGARQTLRLSGLQRAAERTKFREEVFEIARQSFLLDPAGLPPAAAFRLVAPPEGVGKVLPSAPGDGLRHPPAAGLFVGGFDPDGQAPEARVPGHR